MSQDNFLGFIDEDEGQEEKDALKELQDVLDYREHVVTEINDLEHKLKSQKEGLRKIEQERIPEILRGHGLSRIKLADGREVNIREQVSVSVNKDNFPRFVKFLQDRDEADIIKLNLAFPKMTEEERGRLYDILMDAGYVEFDPRYDVHPATRTKYFKELLGVDKDDQAEGIASGRYLRREDVEDFASVFIYWETKVK